MSWTPWQSLQAIDQQGLAVDGVDEVGDCRLVVDGAGFQNDFAFVARGAGLVEVELVGARFPVGGGKNVVNTVAIRAAGSLLVPFRGPLSVNALLVLPGHVAVATGARAVEYQRGPVVVG
jgi:hypothetical protein